MRTVRRHLLPVLCTAAFILVAWVVVTIPIVAVFLIDQEFVIVDYLKFILYAAGVGVGVSSLVMFPLSLLGERLAERATLVAIVVPLGLVFVSVACLLGRVVLTGQFLDAVLGWPGFLLAFSVVFGFYWSVLWIGRGLAHGFQRVRKASAGQDADGPAAAKH